MRNQSIVDLAILALGITLTIILWVVNLLSFEGVFREIVAILFATVVPGYAFTSVILIKDDINFLAKILVSMLGSIAVISFASAFLAITPLGFTQQNLLIALIVVVFSFSSIAIFQRRRALVLAIHGIVPRNSAPGKMLAGSSFRLFNLRSQRSISCLACRQAGEVARKDRPTFNILWLLLLVGIILNGVVVIDMGVGHTREEHFTEFYVLSDTRPDSFAGIFASRLVNIVISNREARSIDYLVKVYSVANNDEILIYSHRVALDSGEKSTIPLQLPNLPRNVRKLVIILYIADDRPYLKLVLQ